MAESYSNWKKTLWVKEKLLATSNFSFSHSVVKRLVSQTRQKVSLCGNGLTLSETSPGFYVSAAPVFENWGKRRICSLRAVSPFPSVFYPFEELCHFHQIANSFILGESKICHMGKGINIIFHSVFYQTNQKPYFDLYLNLFV